MSNYIEPDKLIDAVKRRPALYNKGDALYYNNKKQKARMWIEACKEVYSNWEQLRPQDRLEQCHRVQKRWKSLRTGFTRELQMQKRERLKHEEDGKPIKRRKRYGYFNAMSFLLDPEAVADDSEGTRETDDDSFDPLDNVKSEGTYEDSAHMSNHSHIMVAAKDIPIEKYYDREEKVEGKTLELLREMKKNEEDEDRQFVMSLVPSFKKLKDKQKFEAKIEILRVLKDISFQEHE